MAPVRTAWLYTGLTHHGHVTFLSSVDGAVRRFDFATPALHHPTTSDAGSSGATAATASSDTGPGASREPAV